jgi:hypothetical protein
MAAIRPGGHGRRVNRSPNRSPRWLFYHHRLF